MNCINLRHLDARQWVSFLNAVLTLLSIINDSGDMHSIVMKSVLSILMLTFSLKSVAETDFNFTSDQECTEKRLDKPPESASKIPVQDQDGTNLCSAYTSAQLIDSWRTAYDPPVDEFTSPISLGIQFAAKTNKDKINGNPVLEMLDYAKNLDSCSYSVVRDDFNSKKSADFIYELIQNYKKVKSDPSKLDQTANAVLNCVLGGGNNSQINIEKIKNYMNENNWVQFTNKIIEDLCRGHKRPLAFLPTVEKYKSNTYKDQFKAMNIFHSVINNRLNQKSAQPIGISYCRSVLANKDAEGVSTSGELNTSTCKEGSIHASVIVGRRLLKYKDGDKIGTICQYLVRDSFGSSCNGYNDDPEALPSKPGADKPKTCEKGQIWVDENVLLRNTAEVFHLKDK